MIKNSVTKDIAMETVERVSVASGKTVELAGKGKKLASEYFTYLAESARKLTGEHSDATTITVAVSLLCIGMLGLWTKILFTTGI